MKTEINIAEILKDKPKGTKLYADAFGELSFDGFSSNKDEIIFTKTKVNTSRCFYNVGKYSKDGEPILVPSKKMRDWNKFAWKRGDILVNRDKNMHLIFEKFTNDTYTIFAGRHCYEKDFRNEYNYERRFDSFMTEYFTLETDDADVQTYIRTIENKLGGKLNRETLEVVKTQLEFKDGDIVVTDAVPSECYSKCIFILEGDLHIDESCANSYVFYNISNNCVGFHISDSKIRYRNTHLATDEEKKQLFEALAKENKAWDAEKKKVIDLKPKWIPKPFDRVVTRVDDDAIWTANIFSHIDSYGEYNTIGCVGGYPYCLPYNKETAKLIGTTKEWKE